MSIRARLTLLLTLLTAVVASLSVWLGSGLLSDFVAARALDGQADELTAFAKPTCD